MSDLSPEDLAFLIKVGQIQKPADAPAATPTKDEAK